MSGAPSDDGAPVESVQPGPEFAALQAQAAAIEGAAAPPQPGAPAAPREPIDNAAELMSALEMARMMVAPMFEWWPDFGKVWSDGTLRGIAQSGGAIMERHGWTMGGLMGEFGPYVMLIGSTAPPAFATYQAIRAQREREARAAQRERAANTSIQPEAAP